MRPHGIHKRDLAEGVLLFTESREEVQPALKQPVAVQRVDCSAP